MLLLERAANRGHGREDDVGTRACGRLLPRPRLRRRPRPTRGEGSDERDGGATTSTGVGDGSTAADAGKTPSRCRFGERRHHRAEKERNAQGCSRRRFDSRLAWACGGGNKTQPTVATGGPSSAPTIGDAGIDDQSRCEFEAAPTATPSKRRGGLGATQRTTLYQMIGTGDSMHKVLICREIDKPTSTDQDNRSHLYEKGEAFTSRPIRIRRPDRQHHHVLEWSISKERSHQLQRHHGRGKYYVGGQLSRIQRDMNGDGKADRWEFYNEGKLERAGVDVDFDGHVDRWDHDEEARLAAEAKERGSDQGAKTADAAGVADAGIATTGDLSKLNTAGDGGTPLSLSKRKKK